MDALTRWWSNIRYGKKESGQTLVELALVLPFLLILIFGAIEFGRVFHASHVITSAAREGARAGAVGKSDTIIGDRIEDSVNTLVNEANVLLKNSTEYNTNPDENHVFYNITRDNTNGIVTVKVKGAVYIIVPIVSSFISPNPMIIRSESEMRIE